MKMSVPHIEFLYWKQVLSKTRLSEEEVGGLGLIVVLGAITSGEFTVLPFLLFLLVPWLQSYASF